MNEFDIYVEPTYLMLNLAEKRRHNLASILNPKWNLQIVFIFWKNLLPLLGVGRGPISIWNYTSFLELKRNVRLGFFSLTEIELFLIKVLGFCLNLE